MKKQFIITAAMLAASLAAQAADVVVSNDVFISTTWTSNNVYDLKGQIYVRPGATLTIQAGTLVASTVANQGSLAVSRGAQIFVQGTKDAPVIMTSKNDNFSSWREAANEWGNLTICGYGLMCSSEYGKTAVLPRYGSDGEANGWQPDGKSDYTMEGLSAGFPGDTRHYYGGGNDNDDSGSIKYLSLRYGGKVIALTDELNGLSLGAVGQETDIDYVEIMNNVDDGIEIWGGKVNLKHVSIWNVGDDSFDVDEGWRGQAQFGLLVQGYSLAAAQGSGVGDNIIETDGAEQSDAQPVTTAEIYNFTCIGQPGSSGGDHGTAWRDNAHVQYRNCIWMDLGEKLVALDNTDGDGGKGYGWNGTITWANAWTTPYSTKPSNTVGVDPNMLYTAQTEGFLCEISDSVFWSNKFATAYTEAGLRGVTNAATGNLIASSMPIKKIVRGAAVNKGGLIMRPVLSLDPRAANDAVSSTRSAPPNGFYSQAAYKGAFSSTYNWLAGWSAADRFGMLDTTGNADAAPTVGTLGLGASINFDSEVGESYTIQWRADMLDPWTDLGTVAGTGYVIEYVDVGVPDTGFYQVVKN